MQRIGDLLFGFLFALFGIALWFWIIPITVQEDDLLRLPVDTVPRIVAAALIGCGCLAFCKGLVGRGYDPNDSGAAVSRRDWIMSSAIFSVLLISTIAMHFVPFLIVAPVLVLALTVLFGPLKPVQAVLSATLGPGAIYLFLYVVLSRSLP